MARSCDVRVGACAIQSARCESVPRQCYTLLFPGAERMKRCFFPVILFLVVVSTPLAFSQAKNAFTFEDMMKLKRLSDPQPSPDGKWVLFAAVDVDLAANKKTSHIWIVPLNGATGAPPVQQGSAAAERV